MPRDLLGMGAPVIGIKAPTGSGKTLLALRIAEKFEPNVVIAVVRTWTEMARVWEDARKFRYRYKPLAFFAKTQHCLELRERMRKKASASGGGDVGVGESGDEDGGLEEDEIDVRCEECLLHDNLYTIDKHEGLVLKYPLGDLLSVYTSVNPNLKYPEYRRRVRERLSLINPEYRTGGFCTYDHLKTIAKEAVRSGAPILLIGTYPYVFGFPSILFRSVLGGSGRIVVIIDEAHNLDTLDFLERSISNVRLDRLVSTCEKYCSNETSNKACSGLDRLRRLVNTVKERLVRIAGSYDAERAFKHPKPGHLWELVSLLSLVREETEEFTVFETGGRGPVRRKTVVSFIGTVDFMVRLYEFKAKCRVGVDSYWDYDPSAWGFYITRSERSVRLVAKPFAVKPIIQYAWTRFKGPWILMSGTLPSEQYIEKVWGLGVTWYVDASEKVRIGRRKVVISVREGLTSAFDERSDEMFRKYADKIRWIVLNNNEPGVYLVVYPSYAMMKSVTWYLTDLPVPQRREGEVRHLPDLVEEAVGLYTSGGKLVVHAVSGGRFTEGVEFVRRLGNGKVESLVRHVILAGVPYPNVKDDFVQDRVSASGLDRSEWFNVHGWMNTVQAFGRAFRSEDDEATIWLVDRRFGRLADDWGITKDAVWVRRE